MKTILLIILTLFSFSDLRAQISFSSVESKLKTVKNNVSTELICTNPTMSITFQIKNSVIVLQENNFINIDNQIIQILPLKFSGFKSTSKNLSMNDQKQLLDIYSKYELEYSKKELKIEVIDPNNQWVVTKLKGWFVWYFRVGNIAFQESNKTVIQLFASTVIGDKILTINAPIQSNGDFTKAGLIVNEMMESLNILK